MLPIQFLSTRVKSPTEQDMKKIVRVRNYVSKTQGMYLRLKTDDGRVRIYVDASYAVHGDMKSHSGMIITLGTGSVECQSTKQKMVVKSSCHAELVAVTDKVGWATYCREFLEHQGPGYVHSTILYQDNQSTIKLIENGPGSIGPGSKHISIRDFWFRDYVKSGHVQVQYVPTRLMRADILTKPITGELFVLQRALLLGHQG
jgi:hypothetical protein